MILILKLKTKFTLTDIFDIGYHFGMEIQKLRERRKID